MGTVMKWITNARLRMTTSSWCVSEGTSWALSVALHIRDVYGIPATKPFFVPPLIPQVPEHIPVTGPLTDVALADEWALWFADLVSSRAHISSLAGLLLAERTPAFQQAVEKQLGPAAAAADLFRDQDARDSARRWKADGPVLQELVRSVENDLGRKAQPFELEIRILPVSGYWLHQVAPARVLMNRPTQSDRTAARRLLGPIVRGLA